MRTLGTRRAVLVAGAAAMAVVALAGCSAGQVAETSLKRPSNMGVNAGNSNNSILVRNLAVTYNGTTGYTVQQPAPLQLTLANQSNDEVKVTLSSSRPANGNVSTVLTGTSVSLSGGATPSPSGGASPSPSGGASPSPSASDAAAPTDAPPQAAVITVPPMGAATFLPGDMQKLQVNGLNAALAPGNSVYVTFTFSNGADPLTLPAPVGIPTDPASRAPGIPDENSEGGE